MDCFSWQVSGLRTKERMKSGTDAGFIVVGRRTNQVDYKDRVDGGGRTFHRVGRLGGDHRLTTRRATSALPTKSNLQFNQGKRNQTWVLMMCVTESTSSFEGTGPRSSTLRTLIIHAETELGAPVILDVNLDALSLQPPLSLSSGRVWRRSS